MSGFDARWLDLREPHDAAARDAGLERALRARLAPAGRVVDLGAGTGANLRHLAERLGEPRRWVLVDSDAGLLAGAAPRTGSAGRRLRIETRELDLASGLGALDLDGTALVTASALLDLVSAAWLDALAARCVAAAAPALLVLSYDGRIDWAPAEDPDDGEVRDLVNRHQHRDKGFGPALGPGAVTAAASAFAARGYTVRTAPSDWLLGPDDRAIQRALVEGWATAAVEIAPAARERIAAWRVRRLAGIRAGRSTLRVGHGDLLALPP